jgi:hypothetical protein
MSSEVPRILDGRRLLAVHSAFAMSVNLRAGRRLVHCTTGVISSPNGIEMTPGDLRRLQRIHEAAPGVALEWRPLERAITSRAGAEVSAATPQTVIFDTALPRARGGDLSGPARDLVEHLARIRAPTGLGADWNALTADPALTAAADSLLGGRADDALVRWLGRGPGLTPSGDDVLLGMVAALWFTGAIDSSSLAPLRELVETTGSRLTTEISAEYLHYVCRGLVNGMVRDLLVALDGSDTAGGLDAVDRLRRYGHTSGLDCVLGVLTGLRSIASVHRNGNTRPGRREGPRGLPAAVARQPAAVTRRPRLRTTRSTERDRFRV